MKLAKATVVLLPVVLVIALCGVGTASATVLCKVEPSTSCGATNDYSAGTELRARLLKGSEVVISNGEFLNLEKCKGSKLQGTTANTGSPGEAVRWNINTFTFEECKTEGFTGLKVVKWGSISIEKISGSPAGTLTAEGFEFSSREGLCLNGVPAGTDVNTLTSSSSSTSAAVIHLFMPAPVTSGFNCPELIIRADYEVESPLPLYVAAS